MVSGYKACAELKRTTIYDSHFIRCVTIHPEDISNDLASLDPAVGFQLVSPVGNMFEKYIEYSKHDLLHEVPGKRFVIHSFKVILMNFESMKH